MHTIHKFELDITEVQDVYIPGFISVLSVIEQHERLVLYAIVDTENEIYEAKVVIAIQGTGQQFNVGRWMDKDNFLGSHKVGPYVWHVWYKL